MSFSSYHRHELRHSSDVLKVGERPCEEAGKEPWMRPRRELELQRLSQSDSHSRSDTQHHFHQELPNQLHEQQHQQQHPSTSSSAHGASLSQGHNNNSTANDRNNAHSKKLQQILSTPPSLSTPSRRTGLTTVATPETERAEAPTQKERSQQQQQEDDEHPSRQQRTHSAGQFHKESGVPEWKARAERRIQKRTAAFDAFCAAVTAAAAPPPLPPVPANDFAERLEALEQERSRYEDSRLKELEAVEEKLLQEMQSELLIAREEVLALSDENERLRQENRQRLSREEWLEKELEKERSRNRQLAEELAEWRSAKECSSIRPTLESLTFSMTVGENEVHSWMKEHVHRDIDGVAQSFTVH